MSNNYGIDAEKNPEGIKPSKVLKVISFTVETDYAIVIEDGQLNSTIIDNFKDGKYNDIDATIITSRVMEDSIVVKESYYWGGSDGA